MIKTHPSGLLELCATRHASRGRSLPALQKPASIICYRHHVPLGERPRTVVKRGQPRSSSGSGAGSEVMQRIAAPMIGGMITAPLLSLFVIPAAWRLLKERNVRKSV